MGKEKTGQGGQITRAEAKASPGSRLDKPPGAEMRKDLGPALLPLPQKPNEGENAKGWALTGKKLSCPRKTASTRSRGT